MDGDSKKRARRRALRAAQVVTIALALGSGCSNNDGPPDVDASSMDSSMADTSMPDTSMPDSAMADSSTPDSATPDSATPDATTDDSGMIEDAGEPDTTIADAGSDVFDAGRPCSFPPTTMECCTAEFCTSMGTACFWDEESEMCLVAVPGPFVPPAMQA